MSLICRHPRIRTAAALLAALVVTPSSTVAQPFHWGNVAMGGGGFVSAIVASPLERGLFYARTDVGGAYRWNDTTRSWIPLTDWVDINQRGLLGIEAIAVDPSIPGRVYMTAGTVYWNQASDGIGRSAFLRSSDHGRTWDIVPTWNDEVKWFNIHGNGMGRGNGEALAVDPTNSNILFYGSRNHGLWRSTDNGTTWSHVRGFTQAAGADTTWNGAGFSFVTFSPGSSRILYAGFLREGANVFRSQDGGATWNSIAPPDSLRRTAGGSLVRLMPQRVVVLPEDSGIVVTFADGAGPHTQAWSESWGAIRDGFGRGAILRWSRATGVWSDISPEDFIDNNATGRSVADSLRVGGPTGSYEYLAPYGALALHPTDPNTMVATSMGYRGTQYWRTQTGWRDVWGTNIYHTTDGGRTWVPSFQFYWLEGGMSPTVEQMDENGIGWLFQSSIHWTGSAAFDPFDPRRVFLTSGNGVYLTNDITDFTFTPAACAWCQDEIVQRQIWRVASHGIEETVPEEVVSIPGGPLVSVILDYDGFRHDDVTTFPPIRHHTSVNGTPVALGSTRALAFAPRSGRLVKVADARTANPTGFNNVPLSPLQFSNDSGRTWTVATYESIDPNLIKAASVAISTDGAVTLWTPGSRMVNGQEVSGDLPVQRYAHSAWTVVTGIDGAWVLGDPLDVSVFYAFRRSQGTLWRSTDAGVTFQQVGTPGASRFRKMRAVPGRTGDLWLPQDIDGSTGALLRSVDGGVTWNRVPGLTRAEAVGFGRAAPGATFPSVVAYGDVGGVTGVFLSADSGATWTRVNDDLHEYGGLANGEFVVGDMNTFGVVYMSTAGRGIAARLPGEDPSTVSVQRLAKTETNHRAKLLGDRLRLRPTNGSAIEVRVIGLDGRILSRRSFEGAVDALVRDLAPGTGARIVEVREGSHLLLRTTTAAVR